MTSLPPLTFETLKRLPFFWLALTFLGGIALAEQAALPLMFWLAFCAAALLGGLALFFWRGKRWQFFLPLAFLLGAARLAAVTSLPGPGDLAFYNDTPRPAWLTGVISQPLDVRETYTLITLRVEKIDFGAGDQPVRGTLLLRVNRAEDLRYGDVIRARGPLKTPPESEEFSYRDYLARQGIHSVMNVTQVTRLPFHQADPLTELLFRAKKGLLQRIYRLFPDPEASLMAGILLGADRGMSPALTEAFKNTGTSHIIAISGFNIAIIAAVFLTLFSRLFGKRPGAILSILAIAAYTLLVGADASVVRAAIMGTLSILAALAGRRNFALNTLLMVALLMALWNPLILGDVGFQLSFAATLGLVLYAQPMQEWLSAWLRRFASLEVVEKISGPLADFFLLTLAAQLTTLPVMVYHFKRLSLVSLLVNPLILPAQPPVMILGGLAALASRIYFPLGQALAYLTLPFPAYTIRMVEFFSQIPNGVITLDLGEFATLAVILYYALLIGLTLAGETTRAALKPVLRPAALFSTLMILTALSLRSLLSLPDGKLHLTFLDAASGTAIFVQAPDGGQILINGGPSLSRLSDGIGRRVSPFNRQLDALIVGSTQENDVAALTGFIERMPPRLVLWSGYPQASYSSRQLDALLNGRGMTIQRAEVGTQLALGSGAVMRVLAVSPHGAIWLVEWGKFRALLPLGVDFDAFQSLQNGREIGTVSVLLLAENGYGPANPPQWLTTLSPQVYILSVASADSAGLPDPQLMKFLENQNILRSDRNGWISISSDGEQMWLESERK
ncbi:MAG: hypothetical protein Fur0035_22630 [Anaerolineales bacterium]